MLLREHDGLPTDHADAARTFIGELPSPERGEGHDDERRRHGLAPLREARNRLFEGRVVRRSNETIAHELQARRCQVRADEAVRDDKNRNSYEEARMSGE